MPVFNAEKYIADAVRSVLDQSFTDFELLIVNDGSTDNSASIILAFDDARIRLLNCENRGVSAALNTGLREAKGRYIARFDADDICYRDRLRVQVSFLDSHPEHILVGSDVDYITEEGNFIYRHYCFAYTDATIKERLYFYCPFIHSAVMYRKEPVLAVGGYEPAAHTFEDYFLWTLLAGKGKLANLPESLVKVRLNPASVTMDEKWRGRRFRQLKRQTIKSGTINADQETELLQILREQNNVRMKAGAYYALCAKKFLTDSYMPRAARRYAAHAISIQPLRWDNYALWLACYFPRPIVQWLGRRSPNRL